MKDQTKLIAALFIGAAAGAAAALLLAPDSGKATREEIADFFGDLLETTKEKARTAAADAKEFGGNIVDKAKSKFQGGAASAADYTDTLVDTARSKASDLADNGQSAYEEAKSAVKNSTNRMNNTVQGA